MGDVIRISDVRRARTIRRASTGADDRTARARCYRQRAEELRAIAEEVILKERKK